MQQQLPQEHLLLLKEEPKEEPIKKHVLDDTIEQIAQQIGEESSKIRKHQDITYILERMTDGVVIALHVHRPRFTASIAPKRGGVEFGLEKLGITSSQRAREIIKEYFRLGRHSLLPTEIQKELDSIESTARSCLERYAFKTHWGYFIPTRNYALWKEENKKYEDKFYEKRDYILEHYDEIVAQVLSAYHTLAEDVWKQVSFGSLVAEQDHLSREDVEGLQQQLASGQGKEAFVQTYIDYIQNKIPSRIEVEDAFEYKVELGYIPLPSLLAHDMDEAGHIVQTRALRDAKLQAEMEVIKAKQREEMEAIQEERRLREAKEWAELQKLNAEQRANYLKIQAEEEKLRAEKEKIALQRAMDRDILESARAQKEELIQEFYTGVLVQINELISEVCSETLQNIERNDGLRGPISVRLSNLVKRLKNLNFLDDEKIDSQIKRLEAVLPTRAQREEAKNSANGRINANGIRQVIQKIQQEADEILLELDMAPRQRKARQDADFGTLDLDSQPRRSRRSLDFSQTNPTVTRREARKIAKL